MVDLSIIRTHVHTVTRVASNISKYITMCRKGPVAITINGTIDAFIISGDTYDQLVEALKELEELRKLKQGGAS